MKIEIVKHAWSRYKTSHDDYQTFTYDLDDPAILHEITYVDFRDYDDRYIKKTLFRKVVGYKMVRDITFAFRVLKVEDDKVEIELQGKSCGIWNEKKKEYLPKVVTLKLGDDPIKTSTDSLDSGTDFTITLKK